MLKLITILVGILVVAVAGLLVFASTKPGEMRIQRQAHINAPADRVFALINDFQRWRDWSPYEAKDPNMIRELSGLAAGKGAVYAWNGNKEVGQGRMEIVDSAAPDKITIQLTFLKPMENQGIAEFTLVPAEDGTVVTWSMTMPAPLISKVMGIFFDLDKMIGKDFEVGLANLKSKVEAGA